jgi:hypothetical protein
MGSQTQRNVETPPATADREEADVPDDQALGPNAASIMATEHWSLLLSRSLIWNEAMSRATVFLTLLSASIVALALVANATGFGSETVTLALALLPVVLLLGIATHVRLIQINTEEFQLVLAMNRLRHGYLAIEPGVERFITTSHHDDEAGLATTYMLENPTPARLWLHFLVNTPTIIGTVDAALATVIVVVIGQAAEMSRGFVIASGVVTFMAAWIVLLLRQRRTLRPVSNASPMFPTPPTRS